jgi:DNA polymerase I-like protein with 3'-5' exonuclease and polymerase domains
VSYDHALGRKINKRGVVVTDDHKFLTQRGYVEARKLENSDRVATGTLDLAPTTAKVMAGLLLGDSYSVGRFCLVHGEAQKEYLDLKCKLFLGQGRLNYVNPRHTSKAAYTWTAKQTPAIKYHCEQYQAAWQTYLTQYFTKESAVIWYLDDGCYHKYNGIISVSSYTEEEIEFLRKLLIKTLEVPDESIVVDIKDTPVRKHRIIRLRAEAFKVLAELAGPWTPPCLRYKLGASADIPQFNASLWEPGEPTVFFSPVQVYPASPRKAKNGNEADGVVFCLEVEDTNNFITEGGVVHNCSPFDYNAVDSWAPLVAWYEMKRQYEKQFPSKLAYWHKAEMAEIAEKMQARGVQYDMERAAEISNEIAAKREETAASLPFNPGSSKQILAYFETKGISLESASKEIVLHTLRSTAEEYGYSLDEIDSTSPELLQHLKSLYEWKQAGKGLKSWTDPKYLDRQNRVHPRTIVASTTTGRLSSTSPNMMNVVKRGSMARMREIVVPSRPDYCLVDSDASQLELRIVLFEAGYSEALEGDAYSMTVSAVGNLFDGPAKDTNRKPRDIAKIVVLGTNYMLGYHAYRPGDLRTGFNRQLLDQGAIHIFPNWMYCGMHMCMNGKKLAFLLFGDDTIEHRRKAIEIQLGYLERFPRVLAWQERIAKEVETTNRIVRANGYFLNLYKDPNDNLKKATAFIGQGYGADYCQGAIRAFYQKYGAVPLLTVHDELCFEVPKSWTDEECKQFMSLMSEENDMYPGFRCPIETKRGDSWGTLKPI